MAFAETTVPFIDARVEFWSGTGAPWPRDWHLHIFAARVVHRIGRLLYRQEWLGTEPETVLVHPLPTKHDLSTRRDELEWAIYLLQLYHRPYADRYRDAVQALEPAPIPTSDEWQFAVGLSRQISNETWSAYDRYRNVVDLSVSLLERGVLSAGLRSFYLGEPIALPPGSWYNEVYHAWFATCQVDVDRPFSGIPIRAGGHWIMFDTQPFEQWEASVKRSTAFYGSGDPTPAAPTADVSSSDAPTDVDTSSAGNASVSEDELSTGSEASSPGASSGESRSSHAPSTSISENSGSVPDTDAKLRDGAKTRYSSAVPVVNAGETTSVTKPESTRKRKVGARASYDWPAFNSEVLARIAAGRTYRSIHELADEMAGWCQDVWGKEPSSSRLRFRISQVLNENGLGLEQASQ